MSVNFRWQTIDYRDAVYHGRVKLLQNQNFERNGPGLLLLDNNTLMISNWQIDSPSSSNTIIITPHFAIFQPFVQNTHTQQQLHDMQFQEWVKYTNYIEYFSPYINQFLLYAQSEEDNDKIWNWIIDAAQFHHQQQTNLPYLSTLGGNLPNIDLPLKTLTYKQVKVKQYNSLNKYDSLIQRIKEIIQIQSQNNNNDKQKQKETDHFVIKQTSNLIKKNNGKPFNKITTTIQSTANLTIRIIIHSIKKSTQNYDHQVSGWMEYRIQSINLYNKEQNTIKYQYTVGRDKQSNRNFVRQYGADQSSFLTYFIQNEKQQKSSHICMNKSKLHIRSLNFINKYHNNYIKSIHNIIQLIDNIWKEYLKHKDQQSIQAYKNDIYFEKNQNFLATQDDLKQQLSKIQRIKKEKKKQINFNRINRSSPVKKPLQSHRQKLHEEMKGLIVNIAQNSKISRNYNKERSSEKNDQYGFVKTNQFLARSKLFLNKITSSSRNKEKVSHVQITPQKYDKQKYKDNSSWYYKEQKDNEQKKQQNQKFSQNYPKFLFPSSNQYRKQMEERNVNRMNQTEIQQNKSSFKLKNTNRNNSQKDEDEIKNLIGKYEQIELELKKKKNIQ